MHTVTLARHAMATRFEIALHGEDEPRLRAAGEMALNEIERLEAELSLYRPSSQIARVNARAAREPVKVSPFVFRLLQQAQALSRETRGAFDITVAPLVRCWGFMGGSGKMPAPDDIAAVLAKVGCQHLLLDEASCSARFDVEGAMVDLGAIGKGYAIDCAAEILRDAGVTSALIHGGTSSVFGLGHPPEAEAWLVAIDGPPGGAPVATIPLRDSALSVSAAWGKFFTLDGRVYGHVLDPRTGWPAREPDAAVLAAVGLPSATETDALSTALLTVGLAGHDEVADLRPAMATLALAQRDGNFAAKSQNIAVKLP
jgi:thiamine biosynthesis lipoprotein